MNRIVSGPNIHLDSRNYKDWSPIWTSILLFWTALLYCVMPLENKAKAWTIITTPNIWKLMCIRANSIRICKCHYSKSFLNCNMQLYNGKRTLSFPRQASSGLSWLKSFDIRVVIHVSDIFSSITGDIIIFNDSYYLKPIIPSRVLEHSSVS